MQAEVKEAAKEIVKTKFDPAWSDDDKAAYFERMLLAYFSFNSRVVAEEIAGIFRGVTLSNLKTIEAIIDKHLKGTE